MASDITCIYITASLIPKPFAERVRNVLLYALDGTRLISVSREPLDFGRNLLDTSPKSTSNIYWQMLKAAYAVETEYIAIAEDDCLYHKNHFEFYRPDKDTFCYDQNRFALFTWGEPMYSFRDRVSNASLIAPTALLIEALEERFAKWPNGTPPERTGELGRPMVDRNLSITVRKFTEQFAEVSTIQFNHASSSEDLQRDKRKKLGQIKAYSLYYWHEASSLVHIYD